MKRPQEPAARPWSRFVAIGLIVLCLASLSGLGHMLYMAIGMVASGRGLETYRTFWLVEFNWLSFLVLCGAIFVALIIGLSLRLHAHLQWRSLERKYGGPRNDA